MHALEEVVLEKDEMEAVRLCDLDGKNMMLAAKEMEVSKSTVHRLLAVAHRKMADGLINGKALYVGQEDNFH